MQKVNAIYFNVLSRENFARVCHGKTLTSQEKTFFHQIISTGTEVEFKGRVKFDLIIRTAKGSQNS